MTLRKIGVVAAREYQASVKSKAFIISLVAMPVIMGGGIVAQMLLKDTVDISTKKLAVVDRTGRLFDALAAAANVRNERDVYQGGNPSAKQIQPMYEVERVDEADVGPRPQSTLALSERVRAGEIFAFVEIDASVLDQPTNERPPGKIAYHSNSPTADDLRRWVSGALNNEIRALRFKEAGLDPQVVSRASQHVDVENLGLVSAEAIDPEGQAQVSEAERVNEAAHFLMPMGFMMLMFLAVFVGASPLLQSVLEEKMARIAEVLLGSVTPFELIMGKLIGTVGVSLTMVSVYLAGGYYALRCAGYADLFPAHLIVWFFVYMSLAVLMYGSLFSAIGAAVTDMKEAQSAMLPVMLIAMLPMFVWVNVIKAPTATFSMVLSLFPPTTPMLMLMRQAVPPGIPWWEPVLGVVLVLVATVLCVFAAGRVFRIGILMQGKGATVVQMMKWAIRG